MDHVTELNKARSDAATHASSAVAINLDLIRLRAEIARKTIAKENAERLAAEAMKKVEDLEENPPAPEAPKAVENGHAMKAEPKPPTDHITRGDSIGLIGPDARKVGLFAKG